MFCTTMVVYAKPSPNLFDRPNSEIVSVVGTPTQAKRRSKTTFDYGSNSDCDSEETSAIKDHYNFSNKKMCLENIHPSGSDYSSPDSESYEHRDTNGYKSPAPILDKCLEYTQPPGSDHSSSDCESYEYKDTYGYKSPNLSKLAYLLKSNNSDSSEGSQNDKITFSHWSKLKQESTSNTNLSFQSMQTQEEASKEEKEEQAAIKEDLDNDIDQEYGESNNPSASILQEPQKNELEVTPLDHDYPMVSGKYNQTLLPFFLQCCPI